MPLGEHISILRVDTWIRLLLQEVPVEIYTVALHIDAYQEKLFQNDEILFHCNHYALPSQDIAIFGCFRLCLRADRDINPLQGMCLRTQIT